MPKDQMDNILKSIDTLPPIPEVARKVLAMADDPDVAMDDIVAVIKYDQAITTNCLKLCNSSYFGLREKIFSLDQALVMLGMDNLVKIVLVNCTGISSYKKAQKGYGFKSGELWEHSVTCAILSQMLMKAAGQREDTVLFTAVLLHDIGKLVLDSFLVDRLDELHQLVQERDYAFIAAESELFGVNHAEIGGMVAEKWQFPQTLINSIRNHHKSMSGKIMPNMEAWVRLSNLVFHVYRMRRYSSHNDDIECRVKQQIVEQFGLDQPEIDGVLEMLPGELRKAQELMNIT